MPLSPKRAKARAKHNGLKSRYGADAPETLAARAELKALAAEEYIEKILFEPPALPVESRAKLAGLLLDGGR